MSEVKKITFYWIGLSFILFLFFVGVGFRLVKQDFTQAALNEETKVVDVFFNSKKVHCFGIYEAEECLTYMTEGNSSKKTLYLGNSQLHAINQPTKYAKPVSVLLADKLSKINNLAITFSQPNASFSEQAILLQTLLLKQKFDYLILPAVFDDTREGDVRDINKDIFLNDDYREVLLKSQFISDLFYKKINTPPPSHLTVQDHSERLINQKMNQFLKWEEITSQLRGNISLLLYKLRNTVFGIKPTSTRRLIPVAYKQNLSGLNEVLTIANSYNLKTIRYSFYYRL